MEKNKENQENSKENAGSAKEDIAKESEGKGFKSSLQATPLDAHSPPTEATGSVSSGPPGVESSSAPKAPEATSEEQQIVTVTEDFAHEDETAIVAMEKVEKNVKERFLDCTLAVPGIALKKMAMCLQADADRCKSYLGLMGLGSVKHYKVEKPVLQGLVVGNMETQSEQLWEMARKHFCGKTIGAVVSFDGFPHEIHQVPRHMAQLT